MTLYIFMNFVCFIYCNIVVTDTHDGYTGFTFHLLLLDHCHQYNRPTHMKIVNMIQVINKESRET